MKSFSLTHVFNVLFRKNFVEENLAFYSVFFYKMIRRFLRMDLSSARNAIMLHRLSKVEFSLTPVL